ncbi:MAG: AMP-binding protein, partial [Myxococcales bacterium]
MLSGGPAPKPRHATIQRALAAASSGLTFLDAREHERFFSFPELEARAMRAAGALRAKGVKRGDRVAIVLPTCVEFMDAFFGALFAGAVPVPLYPPVRLGRLEEYHRQTARMLEVVGACLLVTDGRVRRLLGQAVERARPPLGCAVADELTSGPPLALDPGPDALALIQFSSGTTVDPKPVALTHANVLANVEAIDAFITATDPQARAGVTWLPLYHDMGLIGCLLEALVHPGDLCLIPPEHFLVRPVSWLRALSRHRALVSPAPNFAYGLCLKRVRDEELAGVDLSAWRLALNGAEPVSPEVLRRFSERFARWGFAPEALTPVYGLSEASLAVTFS